MNIFPACMNVSQRPGGDPGNGAFRRSIWFAGPAGEVGSNYVCWTSSYQFSVSLGLGLCRTTQVWHGVDHL